MTRSCPECGAEWDKVTVMSETLSDAGYLHLDVTHQCTECHAQWTHGEPQGQVQRHDLGCPVCDDTMLPHKFDPRGEDVPTFHFKCPACYYWTDDVQLVPLDNGEFAFGHPWITGRIDDD